MVHTFPIGKYRQNFPIFTFEIIQNEYFHRKDVLVQVQSICTEEGMERKRERPYERIAIEFYLIIDLCFGRNDKSAMCYVRCVMIISGERACAKCIQYQGQFNKYIVYICLHFIYNILSIVAMLY